ncbi:uncharacterized protein LOC132736561, partial [Ruditapes philippinarum]|uniref:uncharacterized protein LOC132736561 n=1 Tax=Ruditapes philippinarum TaxID=129788 RepID=UPI00295B4C39
MNPKLAKLLSKSDFENYIKSLLGLSITRNAILPVVFDRIKEFQEKCLAAICEKNNLPPGTICTKCPTKKIIASSLSDNSDNESGCQYKICNLFKNEIEENHRYDKPSYLNSDAKLWCSNPWELAKCFMPRDGYRHITCKEETDFNGVINVVINHKMFPNDEIFQQVREISRKIRHNPNLQISNEDFQKNLEILNNILAHREFFDRAKDGREDLEQLRVISLIQCEEKYTDIDPADKLKTELNSHFRPEDVTMVLQILKEVLQKMQEEENEEKHEMPNLCSSNGKLIKLNDCQLKGILQNCEKSPVVGGFGKVHISKTKVPGLDIRVIVKEIICEDTELTKISTTFNEKISRRVMHFAIVPLIGFINQEVVKKNNIQRITKRYYFLSPYLENGSLRLCLERDASEEDIKMKHRRRIEILFQVASAIHYLHSPVKGYRGIVLHMDITSSNIVLDEHFNARLIDFGLAREMNEYQTKVTLTQSKPHGTPGYTRSKTSTSKKYLTVYDDYYNFGV